MSKTFTHDDLQRVGWCDHGRRILKEGRKKDGGIWRGEFCFLNECEVMWWRFNPQLEVKEQKGLWIAPMYEPLQHISLGIKGSPWENF